jgi:hypothetical protein
LLDTRKPKRENFRWSMEFSDSMKEEEGNQRKRDRRRREKREERRLEELNNRALKGSESSWGDGVF